MGLESIDKNIIRYSQCWEDADTLVEHLFVERNQTVLSIASAGDNTLSLLAQGPKTVIAVDVSSAQLALLELKAQCFKSLSHSQMLYFLGVKDCAAGPGKATGTCDRNPDRLAIYSRMRLALSQRAREFFDQHSKFIEEGVINQGKLERYFSIFRRLILPLVKSQETINHLLTPKARNQRQAFYRHRWGTLLYNILFKLFFSRFSMALLGRERCFFDYATGGLSEALLQAGKTALIEQEPACNPYLCWILKGDYGRVLPHYLRPENYEAIKANLPALVLKHGRLDDILQAEPEDSIDSLNLSDVFEYLSPDGCTTLTQLIVRASKEGARMVYWNMLVDRNTALYCPVHMQTEEDYSTSLAALTKTFFYKRLLVQRVCK